jgi:hypothetical protein
MTELGLTNKCALIIPLSMTVFPSHMVCGKNENNKADFYGNVLLSEVSIVLA